MTKTLAVAAIKSGTVIDHVPAGQALQIIRLLKVEANKNRVTVGLNLPSKQLTRKDLIKIEDRFLSATEANEITVFAPAATINIIENFEVTRKIPAHLPEVVVNVFVCPNPACVTHVEPVASHFFVEAYGKNIKLSCKYCEKQYDRDRLHEYVI